MSAWGDLKVIFFLISSDQAGKVVSQEATKLSLAFSKPPLPSQQVRLVEIMN